jgi:hypothetical protein
MKTSHLDDRPGTETASKNYVCWNKDTRSLSLRVEFSNGNFRLFPYGHLSAVGFERHSDDDVLNLCFAGHEVEITGKYLRELGLAFQKLAVDWVRELPARYTAIATCDEAYVARIKVSEI